MKPDILTAKLCAEALTVQVSDAKAQVVLRRIGHTTPALVRIQRLDACKLGHESATRCAPRKGADHRGVTADRSLTNRVRHLTGHDAIAHRGAS